jgi:Domain of unknown function (DUF4266)
MNRNRILLAVLIAASTAAIAGCSGMGVEPWDRDVLARPDMQLVSDPIEAAIDEHIYFSKEASSGGQGFGGGGCGCN